MKKTNYMPILWINTSVDVLVFHEKVEHICSMLKVIFSSREILNGCAVVLLSFRTGTLIYAAMVN